MSKTKSTNLIKETNKLGQSIWLDSLSREMIDSGDLENLISNGISGITSNPTIFEKAISSSNLYDSQIKRLINSNYFINMSVIKTFNKLFKFIKIGNRI